MALKILLVVKIDESEELTTYARSKTVFPEGRVKAPQITSAGRT
jgi:hypothetical protein